VKLFRRNGMSARRARLNIITITTVVLVASLAGQFYVLHKRQNELETAAVEQQANTYAGMVDQHLNFYRNLIDQLAGQQRVIDILTYGSNVEAEQWTKEQRNIITEAAAIGLIRANGQLVLSHAEPDIADLMQTYRARLGSCGRMYSPMVLRGVDGNPYFAIAKPLGRCGDSFIGSVAIAFRLSILTSSIQKSLRSQQRLSIFDNRGNLVASLGARSVPDSSVITRATEVPNSAWTIELEMQTPTDTRAMITLAAATLGATLVIIGALILLTRRLTAAFLGELGTIHDLLENLHQEQIPAVDPTPQLLESRPIFAAIAKLTGDIRSHQQSLKTTTLTDELTELPNRRHFNLVATQLFNLAQRGQPIVVAFVDVDHFKKANDQLGHAIGDEILKIASHVFKTKLRAADFVARIGGDEFVILATNHDLGHTEAMLYALGQRFQRAQEEAGISAQGVTCTFSIGFSAVDPKHDVTLDDTLQRADEALYRAKAAGRNCVIGT
jgi:diguanylate cyclase (GGDEF)-like protein